MEELLEIAKNAFPPTGGSEVLEGLREEVEILWDKWGIPHIFAKSAMDAYFTQGYIHARHHLFQMELFRRLTTGELSEVIGDASLDSDKHYKIIGLHRIARRCAKNLLNNPNNELTNQFQSYLKGVNAGIEKARINPPIEFKILDVEIREWKLEDSLKVISLLEWGLSSWNYPLEILREKLIAKVGIEMTDKIISLYSGANIKNSVGSNGWAVHASKSESGAVLFANDPHLPLTLPPIWFLIHIKCPEFNVIGSSFAGLPMVVLGHNERIAWGCTNVHADTLDLFKLEVNPDNSNQYKYNGEWVDFEVIEDPIKVKDKTEPIPFKVLMTKFGPVVEYFEHDSTIHEIDLPAKHALRWSSFEANVEDSVEAFIKVNKASNWSEFRDGLKKLTINPQNFIYGDVEGNIGHQHGGRIPIRRYGDGATVTPGTDEKFNWSGLSKFEQLFSIYNPDRGFVYTANYNEDKAPNGLLIAQDTAPPYRQMRIKNLLQSKDKFSIQDMKDFQFDYYTEEAPELLPPMLESVKSKDISGVKTEIIALLEKWDYFLTKTSITGTVYKIWCQETIKSILIPLLGVELVEPYLIAYDLKKLLKMFDEKPDDLAELLTNALDTTINFLSEKISPDHSKWKWGDLHKITLVHPFSLANEDAKVLNIGPFKIGGDDNTLNNGYYDPLNNFDVIVGPSYRQIHDLTDWDKSMVVIPGGQSGLPFHKHYKDLMKSWVQGKYVPFLFSREAISKNLEGALKLLPKS